VAERDRGAAEDGAVHGPARAPRKGVPSGIAVKAPTTRLDVALTNSYLSLLRYKVQQVGWRHTLRVGYLDLSEAVLHRAAIRFPWLPASPRSIQIECTTRCNLKCTFCELSYWTEKPADLKLDNVRRMIDHLPRLKRIDLTGIGESLMNREFLEIVAFLKSRGLYVTLNDNFTLLTEATARRIVELGVDHMFLSLDGATKATYEQIRVGANFEKVIANARRLADVKRALGKKRPEIKINTVVCQTNYHEMSGVVELAHDMGIGMVVFVNVVTFEDTQGLDTAGAKQEVERALTAARARARALGVLVKLELFDKAPVEQCDFPWRRNFVTHDGYVHPCCYTTQTADRTAQNRRAFGNLLEAPFRRIWESDGYSAFRRKMGQGILPHPCEQCPKYVGKHDEPPKTLLTLRPGGARTP
jgi:MoaA/NifB/PqqE/SkfB family radical SAM enzyme